MNSTVDGDHEDFVCRDLVAFMDGNYRTVPSAGARGIAGHSMGGDGALYIGMRHPDIFCSLYALSPRVGAIDILEPISNTSWRSIAETSDPAMLVKSHSMALSFATAFSPNSDRPPWFADFPYELVDDVLAKSTDTWKMRQQHDLVTLVASLQENAKKLKAIALDCRTADSLLLVKILLVRMDKYGIPYTFESYEVDHVNRIRARIEGGRLPFFLGERSTVRVTGYRGPVSRLLDAAAR